jgi:LAS superfamily LD-carboxypeptidase LdcB
MLSSEELTGRARSHIVDLEQPRCSLHAQAATAWLQLRAAAAEAGFELHAVSSFRDFARQLEIWNAKYRGERTLLDRQARPLDFARLELAQRVDMILAWSALPGASRHHWGTDLDVIDLGALRAAREREPDFHAQLTPAEFAAGALFGPLNAWLQQNLAGHDFFRPYSDDLGGVMPEPWHISYAPVATPALASMQPWMLAEALSGSEVEARDELIARLPELFERYVCRVAPC